LTKFEGSTVYSKEIEHESQIACDVDRPWLDCCVEGYYGKMQGNDDMLH